MQTEMNHDKFFLKIIAKNLRDCLKYVDIMEEYDVGQEHIEKALKMVIQELGNAQINKVN